MSAWKYPAARRDESAKDDYHGTTVEDPYRWLEDPDSAETAAFVAAQNEVTFPFLETDLRAKYIARMKVLYNYPKYGCPFQNGNRFFYFYNTGLQNHSVLFTQKTLTDEPTVLLDPNTLSADGTTALASTSFTEDGAIMAYALAKGGSDWNTVMFRNVETCEDLPDKLEWVKFSCLAWTVDGKGLFYNKYDPPKKAEDGLDAGTETDINLFQKLMYHRLGTSQDEDILVYDMPEHAKWMAYATPTEDDKYIVLSISEGCDPVNRLYLAERGDITGRINFKKIVDNFDAQYEYVCNDGPVFTFKTNLAAPKYRLIRADLSKVSEGEEVKWETVVPETEDVLEWASVVNGTGLVLCYLRHVKSVLELHELGSGKLVKEFPLEVGSIVGFSGRRKDTTLFFQFTSFLQPGAIFTVDLTDAALEPKLFRQTQVEGFDPSLFTCKQVFYPSKDGTKIPMFIVSRKDIVLDGSNPVLLYGYGGFNISIPPSFRVSRLIFSQHMGGVLAVANIRGGGEYGEEWHKGGTMGNKQNVFDDFQAAAEYLIAEKYTSASKLAIQGGSNGGLLVGACINQRPDLFKVALAQVGVMDMLKFHKFTIGHAWTTDYGCSDKKEDFEWLIKYSPVHNVRAHADVQYPAVLLLTGDHDDRVVPLHSLKLIATLQHTLGSQPNQTNPLMIRVECKAGHGAGKPTEKVIQEVADEFAFLAKNIGIEWRD